MISSHVELERYAQSKVGTTTLVVLTILSVATVLIIPARTDTPSYFAFADQRTFLGVPHFMNVTSNAPWAVIGIAGLLCAWRRRAGPGGPFTEPWERLGNMVLFAAVLAVSIGSAYFHYNPGVTTLVWDRLPMAVIFMSVFALIIGDRISLHAGQRPFWPLVTFGIFSVVYWWYTETLKRGDYRWYTLAQFFPMLAIPVMLVAFPGRYTRKDDIWLGLGWYGLAKLFELGDAPVFALTRVISGHTLKHLAAAITTLMLLRAFRLRRHI